MTVEAGGFGANDELVTRRQWLTRRAILGGASAALAVEAVAAVAIEHDWDMDETKTWAEWEREQT
jgi:hypothetical protein